MERALIFAGDSFLGRHLVGALKAAEWEVLSTSRRGSPGFIVCDLTDAAQVAEVVKDAGPALVVQCAGATHASDPREMVAVHCAGSLNVLEAIREHAPRAMTVLIGTAAEYGEVPPDQLPVTESQPSRPTSYFGASKVAQTELARAAAREADLAIAVVRPFNILGPGLPSYYAAGRIAQRVRELYVKDGTAASRETLPVQNASATRDFVDIRDVAAAIALVSTSPTNPGTFSLFNVATGIETSILELAQAVCDEAGGCRAVDAGAGASRTGIDRSCGDATKLRTELGWAPRYTWRQSVADLWSGDALASGRAASA
jgi:nucleoside-diphosphate-sugar epimerase